MVCVEERKESISGPPHHHLCKLPGNEGTVSQVVACVEGRSVSTA